MGLRKSLRVPLTFVFVAVSFALVRPHVIFASTRFARPGVGNVRCFPVQLAPKEDGSGMRNAQLLTVTLLALLALVMGCNSMQTSSAILRYQQGEFDMADSLCGEALKINPDDGEAYFYRAMSQSMLQEYAEAYKNFRKAAELKPDRAEMAQANIESNFAAAFNEGITAISNGENERAVLEFTVATQANPDNPLGYSNLAKAHWAKAENLRGYAEMKADFIQSAGLALDNFEIGLDKETEVEKRIETAQAMGMVLGALYLEVDKEEREPHLTKYREFTSDLDNMYQPHESFASGLFDVAEDMRTSKRRPDRYVDFYTFAGEGYGKAADMRSATGNEDNGTIPLYAGIAYLNAEMYIEAANYLNMAVQLDPNMEQAWFYMEFSYYKSENYDEAIKAARFIDETLGSTDPQVFQILFQCYRAKAIAADEAGDEAAFLENRTAYEDAYITFATYKGLADVTPPYLASKKEQAAQEKVDAAIFEQDGIAILSGEIDGRFFRGVILNKTEDTVDYVELTIDLKDVAGESVGETFAEIENLVPGEQLTFKAAFIQKDVEDFEIMELIAE